MGLDFSNKMQSLVDSYKDNPLCNSIVAKELQKDFPELTYSCIESRVRRYKNKINNLVLKSTKDFEPITKDMEYKQDGSVVFNRIIELSKTCDITPTDMLIAHGMDPTKWDVITYKNNFWQAQQKGGKVIDLYQSKITVRPKQQEITLKEIEEHFKNFKPKTKPFKIVYDKKHYGAKYLYEINIADLHLGRFCYDEETNDFVNTDVAKKRFFNIINEECKRLSVISEHVEKILFVWTNDFFNSDGISKSTTGGTPQDTDMKWQQLYLTGVEMLVEALETLSNFAPVKTFYIASNHSRQTDYYAINYLNAWFRNDENVEVDINPHPRHYEKYGVNLIGFAHSYYEKKENLPFLMSNECKSDWSSSTYREYHLAHYHSEKVEEKGGIIFRWLPSVTGADTWSNDCGYTMAIKRSYSFVYDKEKGLVQMNSTIID